MRSRVRETWVHIRAEPLASRVTWGTLRHPSVRQVLCLHNQDVTGAYRKGFS